MKPIMQTDLTFETGNCGQACIASILEIPIDDIPSLHNPDDPEDGATYCRNLRNFLHKYGLTYVDIAFNDDHDPKEWLRDCYVIAIGTSPRGTEEWHNHAVVWKNGNIIHDPHPDRTGLQKIKFYGLIIPHDPKIGKRELSI